MVDSPFHELILLMFINVPVIIMIGFIVIFGVIIVRLIQGAKQWKRNNESAVLTVDAFVVTKRTEMHHHNRRTSNMHHMSSTTTNYYATFEVSSGDRMEFLIRNTEYGMLAENDKGKLTFQGTRYLGFERTKS